MTEWKPTHIFNWPQRQPEEVCVYTDPDEAGRVFFRMRDGGICRSTQKHLTPIENKEPSMSESLFNLLSPLKIVILMEIRSNGELPATGHSAASKRALDFLQTQNLVFFDGKNQRYELSPRGEALVAAILALPLPVEVTKWEMPA